jgi:hypothetical protein
MARTANRNPIQPPAQSDFAPSGSLISSTLPGPSAVVATTPGSDGRPILGEDSEIDESLAKQLAAALDLSTWTSGERLGELSARLEREVEFAARYETEMGPKVLALLRDRLPTAPDRSRESGVYKLTADDVAAACRNVLFNGHVEACDGTRVVVPTLPVTVVQIGICLTSYVGTGDGGSIVQRLYRHDITRRTDDAEAQVRDFISQRARRSRRAWNDLGDDGQPLSLSDLLAAP